MRIQTSWLVALLAILVSNGCVKERFEVLDIPFQANLKGAAIECDKQIKVGQEGKGLMRLKDLRFFVHDIEVGTKDNGWVPARLVEDGVFQTKTVALLDFENGKGSCAEGTPLMNKKLRVEIPLRAKVGIRFKIGVPFEQNHGQPEKAASPLNLVSMHGGLQAGYKFLRFDLANKAGMEMKVHLGSTGCEGVVGEIKRCARPNRATVELEKLDFRKEAVVLDAVEFLSRLDKDGMPKLSQCMGAADSDQCGSAFAALGLDLVTGEKLGNQVLFRGQ